MRGHTRRVVSPRDLSIGQVRIWVRPADEDEEDDVHHSSLNDCGKLTRARLLEIRDFGRRLKCCKDLVEGKRLHGEIETSPHCRNRYLANMLVEMYGKCGEMQQARAVFDAIREPNLFSWNIMLAAHSRNGDLASSKVLFDAMPARNVVAWTAMVTAYAQNGQLEEARKVFDAMPERNAVTWNVIVEAYSRTGDLEEAGTLFRIMPDPDVVTRTSLMAAFARHGQLEQARLMFDDMPCKDLVAWTALLQAYAQTGAIEVANRLFQRMPSRNLVSWNAMLQGCAPSLGLELFWVMNLEGERPDENTFISVLNACSHLGLVQECLRRFSAMGFDFGERPTNEHHCCMLDLLGRVGCLVEAEGLLKGGSLNLASDIVPWATVVSAAWIHDM